MIRRPREDGTCGPPRDASVRNDGYQFNMSMNLETRQQQCCIICIEFKLRANKMIPGVNSAVSVHVSRCFL